jgi:hypothetical protein
VTARWCPGDRVLWTRTPRGGYGYIETVPATVVRATEKRVLIEAALLGGGTKRVAVTPERLRAAGREEG